VGWLGFEWRLSLEGFSGGDVGSAVENCWGGGGGVHLPCERLELSYGDVGLCYGTQ